MVVAAILKVGQISTKYSVCMIIQCQTSPVKKLIFGISIVILLKFSQ